MNFYEILRNLLRLGNKLLVSQKNLPDLYKTYDEILENIGTNFEIDGEECCVCIASFLKGFCINLALRLKEEYGYEMETIDIDGKFAHAYCVYFDGCKKYYIDCRGITDDYDLFIEYFNINKKHKIMQHKVLDEDISDMKKKGYFFEDEISEAMCDWYMQAFGNCVDVKNL